MACMSANKVQINAGDAVTWKANLSTRSSTGPAPVDAALTVSSEPNKVSKFHFKATDGSIRRAKHCTKP